MEKKIVLIGGGGHCKSIINILKRMHVPIAGIIDVLPKANSKILDVPVIGCDDEFCEYSKNNMSVLIALGGVGRNNSKRVELYEKAVSAKLTFAKLISDLATVSESTHVGSGTVILDGVIIGPDCKIGENCIINTGSIIEHDCRMGSHANIGPGATICGNVSINEAAFIGAGSTIIQNINIGNNAVVGAGAVVIKNVEPGTTVAGIPARVIGNK